MSRKVKRIIIEERSLRVADVSTMVMWHTLPDGRKEQRCPYCFSRKMRILDYSSSEGIEVKYGAYKFIKKCLRCGGRFKTILDIDDDGNHLRTREVKTDVRETV